MRVAYVVAGPERHGVVMHALGLAQSSPGLAASLVRMPSPTLGGLSHLRDLPGLGDRPVGYDRVMVQVTDRLFGTTPECAADLIRVLGGSTSLVLCLHDLPHPAEGEQRCRRRQRAYGRMARAADVVVVASEHERTLLRSCLAAAPVGDDALAERVGNSGQNDDPARIVVIPLPLESIPGSGSVPGGPSVHSSSGGGEEPELGVLGFLYPGKGIEQVIDVAAALTERFGPLRVTNFGAVAEGHVDYVVQLEALARQRGVRLTVTGFLPTAQLVAGLRSTSVPVAAHRHVSASGSIGTWLGAGRRPVVRAGEWAGELGARIPGALMLTDDLTGGVGAALADPASTWLGGVRIGPGWAEVAQRHLDLLGLGS